MRKYLISLVMLSSMVPLSLMADKSECDDECQKKVVDSYFEGLSSIYREGSTVSDVDALFGSLHQSVRYEHLNYGASFSRDEWKEAFVSNLNRGAYGSAENESIRVEQYIHGKGFVAVSYSYGFRGRDGAWNPKGDQNLLALFEVTSGRISAVKEYW